jgi:nitroimidazol reductase NimA-like FMN-containing flavoprotein (pyridoxamine 5'-phosphate oxidase superfamily)
VVEVDRNGLEVLSREECLRLLGTAVLGRVAVSTAALPTILPVNFRFDGRQVLIRTGRGTKLDAATRNAVVAFEVDEVDGPFDWRSVVAHGTVYVLENSGSPLTRASYRVAVQHLRTLNPQTLGDQDPTPERTVVMQLRPDAAIGREARSNARRAPAQQSSTGAWSEGIA